MHFSLCLLVAAQLNNPTSEDSLARTLALLQESKNRQVTVVYSLRQSSLLSDLEDMVTREIRGVVVEMIADEQNITISSFSEVASRLGGHVEWIARVSGLVAVTASANVHRVLIGETDVVDVTADQDVGAELLGTYTGESTRVATDLSQFNNSSFNGNEGNRSTETLPALVAVLEPDDPGVENNLWNHVGFKDSASSPSRIRFLAECGADFGQPLSCVEGHYQTSGPNTHGTWVTSVAVGDITQGQDPNPNLTTADRLDRTGAAKEAEVRYYRIKPIAPLLARAPSTVAALEDALDSGADVANLSFGLIAPDVNDNCDPSFNPAGLNTTIDTVTLLGMSVVTAAGNLGTGGSCNLRYPGLRPSTINVASLYTTQAALGVPAYSSTTVDTSASAQGGLPIIVNGTQRTTTGISLAAPGRVLFAYDKTNGYAGQVVGTSFAAPAVSGIIASWKDMALSKGVPFRHSARLTKSFVLLMADRFDGATRPVSGSSNLTGHGRVKNYILSNGTAPNDSRLGLANLLNYGAQTVTINAVGVTSLFPFTTQGVAMNPSISRAKVAVWWNESGSLNNVADIKLRLVDTCNGSAAVSDNTFNLSKSVVSLSPALDCLRVDLDVLHLPSQRKVYMAYMATDSTEL
jgi:hypothetical protein